MHRAVPKLLRLSEVMEKVKLGKSTIYKRIAAGTFPAPRSISANRSVWLESEIDDWIRRELKPRKPQAVGVVRLSSQKGEALGMKKA